MTKPKIILKFLSPFFIPFFLFCCTAKNNPHLRVIKLEGTPYQRGLMHGQQLQSEIHQIIKQWTAAAEKLHNLPMIDIKQRFLQKTNYTEAIKKWTPALPDEIRGIADGSGVDYETLFLFQISEELESFG